jgi:predicted nucleic acid-binding protein
MKGRVLIDTNVFMYARGKDHPLKKACTKIIFSIAKKEPVAHYGNPVIDTEVFQEILYRYATIGRWDVGISICQDIRVLDMEALPIGDAEITQFLKLAEKYKAKNVSPRDLIHAAVMINNGINYIITADKHFDSIKEVMRVPPEKVVGINNAGS